MQGQQDYMATIKQPDYPEVSQHPFIYIIQIYYSVNVEFFPVPYVSKTVLQFWFCFECLVLEEVVDVEGWKSETAEEGAAPGQETEQEVEEQSTFLNQQKTFFGSDIHILNKLQC